jgi:seryl-tRNA synthetase
MNAAFRNPTLASKENDSLGSLANAIWTPMGVDGVYGRTGAYEAVVDKLSAFISMAREPHAEVMRFPPVMSRRDLEKNGYLKSFPNLLGCVCALHGSEADIRAAAARAEGGEDWTQALSTADLVLTPAACYPIYPIAAARGPAPRGGSCFDVAADCFRHEPSQEIDRLQSFRMREYVCIGTPDEVSAFRERWIERAKGMADTLKLPYTIAAASDPFFGRTGQMMAVAQIQQALKFELLIPVRSEDSPTACMSFNYHRDHFGLTWGLRDHTGGVAHTGCIAFGMDRLAVALFRTHGSDPANWPAQVKAALAF